MDLLRPIETRKTHLAILSAALLLLIVVACSSSDSTTSDANVSEDNGPTIIRTDDTFTTDSFVNAGWKKSKEYSTETVPDANSIWYGFYKSQDVEIRFYSSHAQAIGPGLVSANEVVDRTPNSNLQGNALFSGDQRTGYSDFMVAGNTVILCQSLIEVCEELVANIP